MGRFKDLTGMKFGRLTVIERAENKGRTTCWRCKCDCGNECVVRGCHLISGHTLSCHCYNRERTAQAQFKHGMEGTKTYRTWKDIKTRCLNSNATSYNRYGGRGITMFSAWIDDFQAFYDYVSKLPHFDEDNYTLDRIDNNGNYEPGNVRWVESKMQARNTRKNVFVDYCGVQMLLLDVAALTGIKYSTLISRYRRGWRGDKLFQPVKKVIPKSDLIVIDNNQALTTSLIIAEKFGKNHFDVLAAIENCLTNLREIAATSRDRNFTVSKIDAAFIKGEYEVEGQKRKYPMYYLNRDAFSLIVMGFTGKEAIEWKWRYIQEFNRMEKALKGN